MSQSPESLASSPVLPYIYKNPFSGPGLGEGDSLIQGEDFVKRPGLVAAEGVVEGDRFGRSDDIFETSPFEGMVNNEVLDEEQAGRFARMGSFVTNKFVELKTSAQESISNVGNTISEGVKKHPKLSKLATGMAVLALAGGAAEQATGENTPANQKASTSALTGNALKQECVKEGLVFPKITNPKMDNPGRKTNYRTQIVYLNADYGALPGSCSGKYRRISDVKLQLQNYKNHNQWINMTHPKWLLMWAQNNAISSGVNFSGNNHQNDNIYYECTPGKGKTEARAMVRNRVKDLRTDRFVGAKYLKVPLKIQGGGC